MADEIHKAAAALGRRGGQVKSPAKAETARANGKLGGPRWVAYDATKGWMSPQTCRDVARRWAQAQGMHCKTYRVRDGVLVDHDGKPLPGPVQAH